LTGGRYSEVVVNSGLTVYVKFWQDVDVLLVFIVLLNNSQLGIRRLGNLNCLQLGPTISEMQNDAKLCQMLQNDAKCCKMMQNVAK